MQDRLEISLLLGLYQNLLTQKQRNIMGMYYDENFSLAEIADINGSSRQAIFDMIKRTEKQLEAFEKKLGIMEKINNSEEKKSLLIKMLQSKELLTPEIKTLIENI